MSLPMHMPHHQMPVARAAGAPPVRVIVMTLCLLSWGLALTVGFGIGGFSGFVAGALVSLLPPSVWLAWAVRHETHAETESFRRAR